ncbi:hypothetical protein PROFUN_15499 [Planoprotostelium fungivorum]|uniref:Protein HRI1 n=1 Tax=Planoprotostelium fungivorum TaxID=1890364 RepID=A0A2P6MSP2_9EUKA|nr:hypothetical protein PROFUN_15499 [Planoprotostelium fungivorum]
MPLISHRRSLRWLPDPPSGNEYFVDLRLLKTGGIDWALAGVKEFLPDSTEGEDCCARRTQILDNPKACWHHHITSRPSTGPDVGSFSLLENGDSLEKGRMVNPQTGREQDYEEVWHEEHIPEGSRVLIIESASLGSASEGNKSWGRSFIASIGWMCLREETGHGVSLSHGEHNQGLPKLPVSVEEIQWSGVEDNGW